MTVEPNQHLQSTVQALLKAWGATLPTPVLISMGYTGEIAAPAENQKQLQEEEQQQQQQRRHPVRLRKIPIGTKLRKPFEGFGDFLGTITGIPGYLYVVKYENGHTQQISRAGLLMMLPADVANQYAGYRGTNKRICGKNTTTIPFGTKFCKSCSQQGMVGEFLEGTVIDVPSNYYHVKYEEDDEEEALSRLDLLQLCPPRVRNQFEHAQDRLDMKNRAMRVKNK
jgi:hypothetical protein